MIQYDWFWDQNVSSLIVIKRGGAVMLFRPLVEWYIQCGRGRDEKKKQQVIGTEKNFDGHGPHLHKLWALDPSYYSQIQSSPDFTGFFECSLAIRSI